MITLDKKR